MTDETEGEEPNEAPAPGEDAEELRDCDDEDWDEDDLSDFFVDQTARDIACAAVFMWGNLLAVLIDTLGMCDMPRELIHDILDRLEGANVEVLSAQGEVLANGFVRSVRQSVPGND